MGGEILKKFLVFSVGCFIVNRTNHKYFVLSFPGMGFSEGTVKEVIRLKITKTKASFDSVSELLEAVLDYENTAQ